MSFQETTSVSWFGRIRRSFGGMLVGLLLVVGMVVLLFWNEGHAVTTARSLTEGAGLVVSVEADRIDPSREGALVHVSGRKQSGERLTDPEFGVIFTGVRMTRTAQMYQWIETARSETRTRLGGSEETVTTYTYATDWSDRSHDSSRFRQPEGHANPPKTIQNRILQISEATLGAFTLDGRVLGLVGGARPVTLPQNLSTAIRTNVRQMLGPHANATVTDGVIHVGANPLSPNVGDYRISYELVPIGRVSIIAQQAGSGLAPYQTRAGNALLMVQDGIVPADKMFEDAQTSNTVFTWAVRIVGILFLVCGFSLLLAPLGVIGDVIPFVGSIVRLGTGIVAAILGVTTGTVTIALAWFYYRPLTALTILAVGAAVVFVLTRYGRKRAGKPTEDEPPAQPAV